MLLIIQRALPPPPSHYIVSQMMEICIDSLESARNAIEGGAARLEVCSALSEGGLTPSPGLVRQIGGFARGVPIYAMIRIRGGNFVYTGEEIDAMQYDLRVLKDHRVNGFVFGALTPDGDVDRGACEKIVSAAAPLPVTFHRAFDQTRRPLDAMRAIVELGFERILTSGQRATALEGLELIKRLVAEASGRIIIMPGAGITRDNLAKIKECNATEFHASARKRVHTTTTGTGELCEFNVTDVTDSELVKELVEILRN